MQCNCLLCSPGRIILIVEDGRDLQIQGKGHLALVDKRTLGPANTGPVWSEVSLGPGSEIRPLVFGPTRKLAWQSDPYYQFL